MITPSKNTHHGEVGLLHEALQRAADVGGRAAGARGVAGAHGIKAGPLHEHHRVRAHGLIKFTHLQAARGMSDLNSDCDMA